MNESHWSHGSNSLFDLQQAIESDTITSIEADISWNPIFQIAVMKHAFQSLESDLAKECPATEWLNLAYSHADKISILKLDFKSLLAVESVIDHLLTQPKPNNNNFQVFLNADIFHGPEMNSTSESQPVNALLFISQCNRFPQATLSLGWTTRFTVWGSRYQDHHIREMLDFIAQHAVHTVFTFPIRASMALDSWDSLQFLLVAFPQHSLTLWTGEEGVPQSELDEIQTRMAKLGRILYVDCLRGPKYARWHPKRTLHLLNYSGVKSVHLGLLGAAIVAGITRLFV